MLNETLCSVCAQIDPSFRVIVVCNRKPNLTINNDKIEIIEVDFPVPPSATVLSDRYTWVYRDKGSKVLVGLRNARKYNPTHIMITDADDYVSNQLSLYVKENPKHQGWFFREGYDYSEITKIISNIDAFQSYCGTSHIIRIDLIDIPIEIPLNPSFSFIQNNIDQYYLQRLLGDHSDYVNYFIGKNLPLSPLPFTGAVWHVDNGENSSQSLFSNKRSGPIWGRDINLEISKEFGIPLYKRTGKEKVLLFAYRTKNIIGKLIRYFGCKINNTKQ